MTARMQPRNEGVEQGRCRQCGAWLELQPSFIAQISPTRRADAWRCVRCGFVGPPQHSSTRARIEPPGSLPPWGDWLLPRPLIDDIHRVTDAYATWADDAELAGLPSLLDHEGYRETPWGRFEGDAHDTWGVRRCLARLRHAPRQARGAFLACLLAERAVLAAGSVIEELRRLQPRMASWAGFRPTRGSELGRVLDATPVTVEDVTGGQRVAPVIGWGRLTIGNRYEEWLLEHSAYPWFSYRHERLHRSDIPDGTEAFAQVVELADALLIALALFANGDGFAELQRDFLRIGRLMVLWRNYQDGGYQPEPRDGRRRPKLPDPRWREQWEQTTPSTKAPRVSADVLQKIDAEMDAAFRKNVAQSRERKAAKQPIPVSGQTNEERGKPFADHVVQNLKDAEDRRRRGPQ